MFANITKLVTRVAVLGMLINPAFADPTFITVQSTTSTQNSGLLDYLIPLFSTKSGIEVRVVAVGTGQALNNARNGDGDVLLVHAKKAEQAFVVQDFGVERFDLMYNDFVLVGPNADPAAIRALESVGSALREIAKTKSIFVSRGDDSGTHKKEIALWSAENVDVARASGSWYRESGSGMGATLNVASGMGGYTLTDRATWISFKNKGELTILFEGDEVLFNQYGIIIVNPQKHPNVKVAAAQEFLDWMLGDEGQQAIAAYQVSGQQLFYPNAQPH